jgi:(E)-4-hydroxy-3-methylbut-2-enyl-diphosphate synthase
MAPGSRPFDIDSVVSEIEERLTAYDEPVEVSVLGSAAKGIAEARHADFGITGAGHSGIVHAKGQPLKKVPAEDLVKELFNEIDKYLVAGRTVLVDDAQAAEAARWLFENEDEAAI